MANKMNAIGIIALVLPVLPASLLILSLRAKRTLDVFAPLQFAILLGGAILAVNVKHTQGLAGAIATVLIAIVGLFTTVLRKDFIARHAVYSFDWEKFERDFQFYVLTAGWLGS
jgi:hypothetical protein